MMHIDKILPCFYHDCLRTMSAYVILLLVRLLTARLHVLQLASLTVYSLQQFINIELFFLILFFYLG